MENDSTRQVGHEDRPLQSLGNHLRWGYGPQLSPVPVKATDAWQISWGACQRKMKEFRTEAVLAAAQISELYPRVNLFVDGSWTSQVMLQAFFWSQTHFTVTMPRWEGDRNLHVLSGAMNFLEKFNISYRIWNLDVLAALRDDVLLESAVHFGTDQLLHLFALRYWKEAQKDSESVVFPFGLPEFRRTTNGWMVVEGEKNFSLFAAQRALNLQGCPAFFKWNPELMAAWVNDPLIKRVMMHTQKEAAWSDRLTRDVFAHYFQVSGEAHWTGFEKMAGPVKKFYQRIKKAAPRQAIAYMYPFSDYYAQLQSPATPKASSVSTAARRVS
jgi:hypothetical protein